LNSGVPPPKKAVKSDGVVFLGDSLTQANVDAESLSAIRGKGQFQAGKGG
jgi:hypothetical protein